MTIPSTLHLDDGSAIAIPHTMTRRTIARRLTEAKQQVPHFYLTVTCRIDDLMAQRALANESAPEKISLNDLIVRGVALSMQEVPAANVSWGDDATLQHRHVDVAVAVATQRGLVTPIVRQAELKPVGQISAELKELASRARSGRLAKDEYTGGTVSVSNLGMFGVQSFSAIVNPPQSCIFSIGAGEERPIIEHGRIEIGTVMTVSVSVDHRTVDGAIAAKVLEALKRNIEEPRRLFA
jgi:pyruvate dehydrogenase E2 component (dihydrolipoamide acetyltransferase)